MDSCQVCGQLVDTDFDVDCYDNPAELCACVICREAGEYPDGWRDIETAPHDRVIELAAYIVPSTEAQRNGSRAFWANGKGQKLHWDHWTGILGGHPSHWREPGKETA